MRILCGTNFSEQSTRAVEVAAGLATRGGSPMTLAHAVEPGAIEFLEKQHLDLLRKRLQQKLESETLQLRKAGVHVSEKLVLGSPDSVLPELARREKADLIVLASSDEIALLQRLRRQLAERVAQSADVTTLAVRDDTSLLKWVRGEKPLKIFVCYDFSPSSDAALRWVKTLEAIGPSEITVAYLSWPPNETMRFGIGGDTSIPGNTPDVQALLERELAQRCRQVMGEETTVTMRVIANWTREDIRVIELATKENADLIVVGTSRRTGLDRFWLGSVSRAVLRHAPTNVACVPVAADAGAPSPKVADFERILVPTDLTATGDHAVRLAFESAKAGGEVCLLHVVRPVGAFGNRSKKTSPRARRRASRELRRLIPADSAKRGIRHRLEVVEHEHPSVAIRQAAERFDVDLICLGSRKKRPLRKKIFGSTTGALMRRSARPIWVIHS